LAGGAERVTLIRHIPVLGGNHWFARVRSEPVTGSSFVTVAALAVGLFNGLMVRKARIPAVA
jgi:hypothetical protein